LGARADLALYVVCDTAMIQTDPSGFIRRPMKIRPTTAQLKYASKPSANEKWYWTREKVAALAQSGRARSGQAWAGRSAGAGDPPQDEQFTKLLVARSIIPLHAPRSAAQDRFALPPAAGASLTEPGQKI